MTAATRADAAWLVVIDPQVIFADASSEWGSQMWPDAVANIKRLLPRFAGRTIFTRWVAPDASERVGSWASYMAAWPFADRSPDDPAFDIVDDLRGADALTLAEPTFGKWRARLKGLVGEASEIVLCGVSTDCCVVSTALPAADDGATIVLVTDACAGSTPENHAAALHVMGLYPPQITLATTDEVLKA